jgi:hypothetical protein
MQELRKMFRLGLRVEGETVKEVMINDRKASLPGHLAMWLQPYPCGETVLGGKS